MQLKIFDMLWQSLLTSECLVLVVCVVATLVEATEDAHFQILLPQKAYLRPDALQSKFVPSETGTIVDRLTIENMTCDFFTQPLNHFVPRGKSPNYRQRYCTYEKFAIGGNGTSPILFYTGNESPLEQYINHTGLMWELAPQLHARVVFVEHRYEGMSLPNISKYCLSYSSTMQALADYARILERKINVGRKVQVIAFGGSYGGMLSAWMRMKYPHLITGAIAASAPIGGFPQASNFKIDGAARVLTTGLQKSYPPDAPVGRKSTQPEGNFCTSNLLAVWSLITWMLEEDDQSGTYASFLQENLHLCQKPSTDDIGSVLGWAQAIWFDMAEGSFPYPSSYIPFALLHKKVNLPPWPTQTACWNASLLHKDWGVRFEGDLSDVRYNVSYGDSEILLSVDWDNVRAAHVSTDSEFATTESRDLAGLVTALKDAVSVWYNITKDVDCYDVTNAAPNRRASAQTTPLTIAQNLGPTKKVDPYSVCHDAMKYFGSWESLCCNDEMNLVITEARGLGNDFFWPPSHPRGVSSYADAIRNVTPVPCPDPNGTFGYSKYPYDPWSRRLEAYYGGIDMRSHSNIVFSNGLLDPWSAGGVYSDDPDNQNPYSGPMIQQINERDVVAVIIELGGHHTDLMYSHPDDPECVSKAREAETMYILRWIDDFQQNQVEAFV